jgi:hypothetical protein
VGDVGGSVTSCAKLPTLRCGTSLQVPRGVRMDWSSSCSTPDHHGPLEALLSLPFDAIGVSGESVPDDTASWKHALYDARGDDGVIFNSGI